MIGLSISAIGGRPFDRCLEIYRRLALPLGAAYLELAVGSGPFQWAENEPLVLHDRCLYSAFGERLPFSLMETGTWEAYKYFCRMHPVLAVGVHAPTRRKATLPEMHRALAALERCLGVPAMIECMPSPERWCSDQTSCRGLPLLLDVSHVYIWHQADAGRTAETCLNLLPGCLGLHLSHNDGTGDDHDLITDNAWFVPYIPAWAQSRFITYESLPICHAEYERVDKQGRKRSRPS